MNEENQVYFVDSDTLPPEALARKHRLEQDPSFRTNHMEYMPGMEIIDSDIKDKVLAWSTSYIKFSFVFGTHTHIPSFLVMYTQMHTQMS